MAKNTILKVLLVVALLSFSSVPAYADTVEPSGNPTDVSVSLLSAFSNQVFGTDVCNNGPDTVVGLTYTFSITDFNVAATLNSPKYSDDNAPTNHGTLNPETGIWVGELEATQCLSIAHTGLTTGDVGDVMQFDVSVTDVILSDLSVNVDPNESNNSATLLSPPVTVPPDLLLESRLLTSGTISAGSQVRYEVTVSNIGDGAYDFGTFLPTGIYAILPTGATLVRIIDVDHNDEILIDGDDQSDDPDEGSQCAVVIGDIHGLGPAFDGYDGALYGCNFTSTAGIIGAGDSFKFIVTMTATGSFASGDTSIALALAGDDGESFLFQQWLTSGLDPFAEAVASDLNNISVLTYDTSVLTATVSRCEGLGDVVTVDDACFTMTFNKPVYEGEFTQDDLIVDNGSVYSFVQDSPTQWTIRINGMTPNSTLTINLGIGTVVDLSAVTNDTYVLGINTIRYEVPVTETTGGNTSGSTSGAAAQATTATGTLSNTGSQTTYVFIIATALIVMGLVIALSSKKRKAHATNM